MKDLNANTIKTTGSQSVSYKGAPLTVAWGGEFYTAIYNGDVFRQTIISDLKKDISNGWACNDCREDDLAWVLPMQEKNLKTPSHKPKPRIRVKQGITGTSFFYYYGKKVFERAHISSSDIKENKGIKGYEQYLREINCPTLANNVAALITTLS